MVDLNIKSGYNLKIKIGPSPLKEILGSLT